MRTLEPLEPRALWSAATAIGATPARHHRPAPVVLPKPDHVVVVMEENHSFNEVFDNSGGTRGSNMPYLGTLAANGALFTNSHSITHPSQPNYLALFSGSTQGVSDDSYVQPKLKTANLGGELLAAHDTFAGYSEDMPSVGYTGEWSNDYAKKHNAWVDFRDVPATDNLPLPYFPKATKLGHLPTVSFVVPNEKNDMHSGSNETADAWLQSHLGAYAKWAMSNNSLLIVTWDEGNGDDHIATLFYGPMVKPGLYGENISHYNVLRTLEQMYGLSYAGQSASAAPVADVWKPAASAARSAAASVVAAPAVAPAPGAFAGLFSTAGVRDGDPNLFKDLQES